MIYMKDDGGYHYPLMGGGSFGGCLAVIKRCLQGEEYIQLVSRSIAGYWFVVKDEKEAGMSKRMENFMKAERHKVERIKHYRKHFDEIRKCKHGHQMGISHRLSVDEYFCRCLLCGCEGGHSKDIDEAVRLWNEEEKQ